jgi:choline dehydrogenase
VTDVYDYVIVGGGSAGCVLAARLGAHASVLLLEAGTDPSDADLVRIPAGMSRLFKTRYDWNYSTVPQNSAAGREVYWPRGRALGGSSAINAMIYIRGNRLDYDTWRDRYGCKGWGYSDMLPYFRRAEDNARGEGPYHGAGGPLPVCDVPHHSPQPKAFVAAATERGLVKNPDFNAESQDGVGFYQVTQRGGARASAADAYLSQRPAKLTVRTSALATGVVIEGGRAAGVSYLWNGSEHTTRAEGEVILAAGAVNTPQLLMLSGIGPADDLRDAGVFVVVDNPGVGSNLIDHPAVPLVWDTPRVRGIAEHASNPGLLRWQLTHRGPLTSNLAEAGGFARSNAGLPAPDLQWHVIPAPYLNEGLTDPVRRGMTALVTLVDIHSRGRIRLASRDPRHRPLIDPCYLSDDRDLQALVAGVRMTRDIASARPMTKICTAELSASSSTRASYADIYEFIRRSVTTLYHPVGTCAMGGERQRGRPSVVDNELRVRGISGLRVVDASIMPTVPRGNTNAPVIAIAERAADLIAGRAPLAPAAPGAAQVNGGAGGTAVRAATS